MSIEEEGAQPLPRMLVPRKPMPLPKQHHQRPRKCSVGGESFCSRRWRRRNQTDNFNKLFFFCNFTINDKKYNSHSYTNSAY
jgi:hypothetical protein